VDIASGMGNPLMLTYGTPAINQSYPTATPHMTPNMTGQSHYVGMNGFQ
jgi:hypothetical protein